MKIVPIYIVGEVVIHVGMTYRVISTFKPFAKNPKPVPGTGNRQLESRLNKGLKSENLNLIKIWAKKEKEIASGSADSALAMTFGVIASD